MLTRAQAKLIRKLRSRKRREEQESFLVEGIRLVEDLLKSPIPIEWVATSPSLVRTPRGRELCNQLEAGDWVRAEVSDSEMEKLAGTQTPQGVLVIAGQPQHRLADYEPTPETAVVVFDRIGDPGNLGTLIRTCFSLGVGWAIALPGTVDPWNPKAVRSAAGSSFRLPISHEPWPQVVTWLRRHSFAIFCADAKGDPVRRDARRDSPFALVLGSEPVGASDRVLVDCDRRVAIELRGGVDSLNVAVAGALLLDRLLSGSDAD